MSSRYLTEEEQRRRVRVAALKLERELLDKRDGRAPNPSPKETARLLSDVRLTLEHVGRAGDVEEIEEIEKHQERLRLRREESA
jgi:hypothetical protein